MRPWVQASLLALLATVPQVRADEPASFSEEAAPTVRPYGAVESLWGVDTRFDSPRHDPLAENVTQAMVRTTLGADVHLSDRVRALVEGRALWRGSAQRAFDHTKASLDVQLGEAFVDLYTKVADLRLGNQIVAFGANPAFAPADRLNPRDLRLDPLLVDPLATKLPKLGARALGTKGKLEWTLVWMPFFRPSQYAVSGDDQALIQPALGLSPGRTDPSEEDLLLPQLGETSRPRALPWLGDVAARARVSFDWGKLGASYVLSDDTLPVPTLDPELKALFAARARGEDPNPAVALSVQNRLLAGESLFQGRYERRHLVSLEGEALWGPRAIDVDVGYSPSAAFETSRFDVLERQTATWVLGVSRAEDAPFMYAVSYVGTWVDQAPKDAFLILLEPPTAQGEERSVWLHLLLAQLSYRFERWPIDASLRAALEPIQGSFVLCPEVKYRVGSRLHLGLSAEVFSGPKLSAFGYLDRNDQIVAHLEADLF